MAAQVFLSEFLQFRDERIIAGPLGDDKCLDHQAADLVRDADGGRLQHIGVFQ